MEEMLEVSLPRIEIGFDFGGLPIFIVVLGMPHLVPEVTKCRAKLGNRAVNADSDTFNFVILLNRFTHAAIGENLREDRIDSLNEIWGYA